MTSNTPIVSVIVPTYNNDRTIGRAVSSVLNQSFSDLECIVVDDGSRHDVSLILAECASDSRVRIVRLRVNQGRGLARQTGLELARGEYVAWQDADDYSAPTRFTRQVAFLDRNPHVGMVGTRAFVDFGMGDIRVSRGLALQESFLNPLDDPPLVFASVMMRSQLAKAVGFSREFRVAEDYDFQTRAMRRSRFSCVDELLYVYDMTGSFSFAKYLASQRTRVAVLRTEYGRTSPLPVLLRALGAVSRVSAYFFAMLLGREGILIRRGYQPATAIQVAAFDRIGRS